MNDTNDFVSLGEMESTEERTPGERAAVAKRVTLHRARKRALEGRDLVLSEKQASKQRHKTEALFAETLACLTPAQRQALETGTDEFPTLRELNDLMFTIVHLVDLECFDHPLCRPDILTEFRDAFVKNHLYARSLISPQAWFAYGDYRSGFAVHGGALYAIRDSDGKRPLVHFDEDSAVQLPMHRFDEATKVYERWRLRNSPRVDPIEKRKRGRPRAESATAVETPTVDPAIVASWTTGPTRPQAEIWGDHEAALAAMEIKKDLEHAAPTKPVVFDGM